MKKKKRLDTEDSAKFLSQNSDGKKIGTETLRRFIREGKIEPIKGGPPYFFRIETLENFIPFLRPVGNPRRKNLSQGEAN